MAVERATDLALRPMRPTRGCTDTCGSEKVLVAGRGALEWRDYHDPHAHERYGRRQGRTFTLVTTVDQAVVRAPNGLVIDLALACVTVAGRHANLPPAEWRILATLAGQAGRPISSADLAATVFDDAEVMPVRLLTDRARTVIERLRRRLGPARAQIVNQPGIGYRLALEEMSDG